jgi:hypothetical protein
MRRESTRVNPPNPHPKSWDWDNSIEKKLKETTKPIILKRKKKKTMSNDKIKRENKQKKYIYQHALTFQTRDPNY